MARETAAERRERIQKEVEEKSAAREKAYFEAQAKSKAAAEAKAPPLPASDAYNYSYAWRQDVGAPTGELKLVKTPNPFYDASQNAIVDPNTGLLTPSTPSMWSGSTTFRGDSTAVVDPYAGLTPEQIDARKNAEALAKQLGLSIDPKTGMIIKPPAGWVIDPATGKYVAPGTITKVDTGSTDKYEIINGVLYYGGKPFTGGYGGKSYKNGKEVTTFTNDSTGNTNTSSNADLLKIIQGLQDTISTLTSNTAASAAASAAQAAADKAAANLRERQSAFDVLYAEMDALGLAALVEPLRGLIQRDVSPSEFTVQLRQTEAYQNRFIANKTRLSKGLRVLTPGEYIKVEDAYRQTLRDYGLKQFDNDAYVQQFIANDISAAELSDRVSMAVQRVQNADPAITRTLRDYYGIGQTDLVAYVLDPNQQLQKIQRQIAAAEIGTAARVQGIEPGVGVAEQLAAQGISQAQAQKGYATIADILPTAEKLSQIYGATMEGYGLAEGEQEYFNLLASAQRRRQRLTQREVAEFSGQSGLARNALSQQARGQF